MTNTNNTRRAIPTVFALPTWIIVAVHSGKRTVLGEVQASCEATALSHAHLVGVTYSGLVADRIVAEPTN